MMIPMRAAPAMTSAVLPRKLDPLSDANAEAREASGLARTFKRMTSRGARRVTAIAPLVAEAMTWRAVLGIFSQGYAAKDLNLRLLAIKLLALSCLVPPGSRLARTLLR